MDTSQLQNKLEDTSFASFAYLLAFLLIRWFFFFFFSLRLGLGNQVG